MTCTHCHDSHTGALLREGNDLCMSCHGLQEDFVLHSYHPEGEGDACVDCHMPETVYMERDPRRDHGMTTPDPQLTADLGIPNACNGCHADQPPAWSSGWLTEWFGDQNERRSSRRARAVAMARAGDPRAPSALLALISDEENNAWRAVLVGLLEPWAARPEPLAALIEATRDETVLVRRRAAEALLEPAFLGHAPTHAALRRLLGDPSRSVRVAATASLQHLMAPDSPEAAELMAMHQLSLDQPGTLLTMAWWHVDHGRYAEAVRYAEAAVERAPNQPEILEQLRLVRESAR